MATLICDDHPLFAEGLRLLLRSAVPDAHGPLGEVLCCTSGDAALQMAQATPFDLLLLDWNLGTGLSGPALLAALKGVLPQARVVVISGESGAAVVRQAIDAGAVGFVAKESQPQLLVDALTLVVHGGIYLPLALLGAPVAATGAAVARVATAPADGRQLRRIHEAFPQLTARHVVQHLRVACRTSRSRGCWTLPTAPSSSTWWPSSASWAWPTAPRRCT